MGIHVTVVSIIKIVISITAELGRALAVVKVTLQVNGNSQCLGVCPQKTMGAIKIKSGTNDYVGEENPHAKFGNSGITGGGRLPIWVKYNLSVFCQ